MKLQPLSDRVLIERSKKNDRTAGGIIIPETASDQEQAWHGVVLAVGPGKIDEQGRRVEPRVKAGDRVIVGKYHGTTVSLDGAELVMAREDDLLAIVEE